MILLTDTSFFRNKLEVVNLFDSPAVAEELREYIREYEPKLLRDVLGVDLYTTLKGVILDMDVNFRKLMFGDTYTVNDKLRTWRGLIETDIDPYDFSTPPTTGYKRSFIANYIYYYWLKKHDSISTGIGEKRITPAGTTTASLDQKMRDTWNDMSEWIFELWQYLEDNQDVYSWDGIGYRDLLKYSKIPIW
jgi:hypothetical protein